MFSKGGWECGNRTSPARLISGITDNKDGRGTVFPSVQHKHGVIVPLLLKASADPNKPDRDGHTLYGQAAVSGLLEAFEAMLVETVEVMLHPRAEREGQGAQPRDDERCRRQLERHRRVGVQKMPGL
jgi:ankyrin repeat protein